MSLTNTELLKMNLTIPITSVCLSHVTQVGLAACQTVIES